ncbi:ribonuclease E/G [Gracilibacillus thailandensis]|uniref:S1 RNA-binding domain-containing protein n=1 Tax=Gracilibacillus thailandensis TaxID=563735 RepID=A0A6N7R682_9BACI|nr:ribonuclease E/G [Gracilibacillus thailandensis]MRI68762.1 S1 RNA-binding domain-containing protein [Gracilibacillus thailandensis]
MKKLHFYTGSSEKIGMLFEEKQCIDIFIDRQSTNARLGSIYKGKVRNVDESIDAAFIDIGEKKVGFLPKSEVPFLGVNEKLSSYLTDGASIIVQVIKEAYQEKGPRLTANITLTGQRIIYLPYGNYVASSKKISQTVSEKWKNYLKEQLSMNEGVILRTDIANAETEQVLTELNNSRHLWRKLDSDASQNKAPYFLFQYPMIPDQMINRYQNESFQDITFDERQTLQKAKTAFPNLADRMRIRKEANQIAGQDVSSWLTEAIQPVVHKQDGITLTVEQTEALTVIDIDSSKFTSRHNKQDTLYRINHRSVKYCIEEIRKRNISGIILIDFLKMAKKEEAIILQQMKQALREDPVRTEVLGFTKLGLLEMTRKRERTGLLELMTNRELNKKPVLSMETIGYRLERELLEWNRNTECLLLIIHPDLYAFWKEELTGEGLSNIQLEVYFYTDENIPDYQVIRSGSKELINLYIADNPEIVIDKLL